METSNFDVCFSGTSASFQDLAEKTGHICPLSCKIAKSNDVLAIPKIEAFFVAVCHLVYDM